MKTPATKSIPSALPAIASSRKFRACRFRAAAFAGLGALGAFAQTVSAQVFTNMWSPNSGNSWNTIANWSQGVIPDTVGSSASFSVQPGPTTVTLDVATTTGHIQLLGTDYSISGGNVLTLETNVGASVIQTTGGTHTIATPVFLNSDMAKMGAGTVTMGGIISGTKGITVAEGALVVGGYNNYDGATTISGGVLRLASGSVVNVANNSFETHDPLANGTFQYAPTGATWTFVGGTGIATNSSPWFNTSAPDGTRGAFIQGDSNSISQTVNVGSDGIYTISFAGEARGGAFGTNGIVVQIDCNTVGTFDPAVFSGAAWQPFSASAALTAGNHTIAFLGNNVIGGDRSTVIDNVRMSGLGGQLPANTALSITSSGASFDLNGVSQAIGSLAGVAGSTVTLGSGTLTTGGDNTATTFAGAISGSGGLAKQGNAILTLTGNNTYTGTTTIAGPATLPPGGALQVGNGGTTGSLGTGRIVNNGNLAFNRSDNISEDRAISGSGNLIQVGSGVLTLTSPQAYTGATVVASGTLRMGVGTSVAVQNSSFEAPAIGIGNFVYFDAMTPAQKADYVWTGAVLQANGSAWGYAPVPGGTQGASLQQEQMLSQTINFPAAGTYALSWRGASRSGQVNPAVVRVDGADAFQWQTSNTAWTSFATQITVASAGDHTITFAGLNTGGGDKSVGIDQVAITSGTGVLPRTSNLIIVNGGTLDLNGTTQEIGEVGNNGPTNGIVGNIVGGTLNILGNNMYFQSGTLSANITSTAGSEGRLWIGGDAAATVLLGGNNTVRYSDTNSTIIGFPFTTGNAGLVKLTTATALGPVSQNAQLFTGTLDFNGQTAVTTGTLLLASGANSKFINGNTSAASSYANPIAVNGADTNIGGPGNLTLDGAITGSGGVTKIGAGTLNLNGALTYLDATNITDGTLNVNSPIGAGSSTVNALGGTTSFRVSQTLGALDISSGAVVTLGPPPGPAPGFSDDVMLASEAIQPVPEPSAAILLLLGALAAMGRSRRPSGKH